MINTNRNVVRILFIVCLAWQSGCGVGKGERAASNRVAADSSSPDEAPAPRDTASAPHETYDAVSRVYFGEPTLPHVKKKMALPPLKGGSVVLIVFDAFNVKHLGVYGYSRPTSPNVDALAKKGIVSLNHVSNSSWTRPSFTTIITGQPKRVHGVELEGGNRLKSSVQTLAERFHDAGYRTAGFTGNPLVRKGWGFDQGFETYEDPITLGRKAFPPDRLFVDEAVDWLNSIDDKPFFLVLFLTSAHPPYRPPSKPRQFLSEAPPGEIIEHPFKEYQKALPKDAHDRIVAAYDDEVAYMDAQVGRLMEYLASSGKSKQTVIAVTADHGEVFGLHNCYLHAYHMWEPALRVPLIINAPNLPVSGVTFDRPSTHVDIAPTLLDLAGIPYAKDSLPGISLAAHWADSPGADERVRFSQFNAHGVRRQAVRIGKWKLVHHNKVEPRAARVLDELHPSVAQPDPRDLPTLAWDKERYELYDLLKDPNENHNLFAEYQGKPELDRLMAVLEPSLHQKASKTELTDEMKEALINAGYIRE